MLERVPGLPWLSSWSAAFILGSLLAWWLARRRARALGLDPSHLDLALPLAFGASAALSSLLDHVVPGELELAGPALLAGSRPRLAVMAPIFVAVLLAYGRAARLPLRRLADAVAVPSLLWAASLRVGCFLGGCCFGGVCGHAERLARLPDLALRLQLQRVQLLSGDGVPTAVRFPAGSLPHLQHRALGLLEPGAGASLPVHPVQLYESAALLLAALALSLARRRMTRAGDEAVAALASCAAVVFLSAFLHGDDALVLGPLTANQLHTAAWGGVALYLFVRRRAPATPR